MNKKITAALIAAILAVPVTAQANIKNRTIDSAPTLAVIDTAINSKDPSFSGKVIYEVCLLVTKNCANGQESMEGPGAANIPAEFISKNGFDHGSIMVASALAENPGMNIVFIRIVGHRANGTRDTTPTNSVANAINWVIANKDKFNIKAINMSQGHHNLRPGTDYCPKIPAVDAAVESAVSSNIPVFFPTGNNWDSVRIDWPSCIPSSIAVGGIDDNGFVGGYSNHDNALVDFLAKGTFTGTVFGKPVRMVGTSVSSTVAASNWIKLATLKPGLTYTQVYDLFVKTSTSAYSAKVKTDRVMNFGAASNG